MLLTIIYFCIFVILHVTPSELVGLERGPLSLMSITEELLEWKSRGSGSRQSRLSAVGIHCGDDATPSIRKKLALTSPTCGDRSVGIISLRTKATRFSLVFHPNISWRSVALVYTGCIFDRDHVT
jgi:hypothetical protein